MMPVGGYVNGIVLIYEFCCNYDVVSKNVVPQIAKYVVNLFKTKGMNPSNIHIYGHSLGAQIAAYIGKEFKKNGQTLNTIYCKYPILK